MLEQLGCSYIRESKLACVCLHLQLSLYFIVIISFVEKKNIVFSFTAHLHRIYWYKDIKHEHSIDIGYLMSYMYEHSFINLDIIYCTRYHRGD